MEKQFDGSLIKSLCLGRIPESLFPYPKLQAEERETLKMIVDSIDRFMSPRERFYRDCDQNGEQPAAYIKEMADLGLFGLIIPAEYGGIGLSNRGYSRIVAAISRHDASTSLTVGAHTSIGLKGILLFGTAEQKARYLPKLATGEYLAAFCLTESGSGSDAGSIKTSAIAQRNGSFLLNGEKIWITNGGIADVFTVFARTGTLDGKMTAFIVERSFAGVSSGPKEDKMGIRASCTTTVRFENVVVPKENVLGEVGAGFKIAMTILNNGRTGLGGGCIGAMKRLFELSVSHAKERKQFGKYLYEFPIIAQKLANMEAQIFAAESVVGIVGGMIDEEATDYSVEAAVSKVYATEALWDVAYQSLQIAGGNGFMRDYPYERFTRDSRINTIFEGTNEILRLYIALTGLRNLVDEIKNASDKIKNFYKSPLAGTGGLLTLLNLWPYKLAKANKNIAIALSLFRQVGGNKDVLKANLPSDYYRLFAQPMGETIGQLGIASRMLIMRHRKELPFQQLDLKKLSDAIIYLFVALSTISRAASLSEEGREGAKRIVTITSATYLPKANNLLVSLGKNHEQEVQSLAREAIQNGGYSWDLINE